MCRLLVEDERRQEGEIWKDTKRSKREVVNARGPALAKNQLARTCK